MRKFTLYTVIRGPSAHGTQLPLLTLTIVTTIGSYYGIGAKDATFALPGNQKYVETAYFVSYRSF